MTSPADVSNQALDAIGSDLTIGDLEEGTKQARAVLRIYVPTIQQISRTANWAFARKQQPALLLQDATGQTANVGTGTAGMGSWRYEYAYPVDCLRVRYVTWTPPKYQNQATTPPPMQSVGVSQGFPHTPRARFLVTQDAVPGQIGAPATLGGGPDLTNVVGQGPTQATVILTNVQSASVIYTAFVPYPDVWDVLFRQAVVAALAVQLAPAVLPDKKFAMQVRRDQVALAKTAIEQARIADGNEGATNVDHNPDWMRARSAWREWGRHGWGDDGGVWGYGWESCSLGGEVF